MRGKTKVILAWLLTVAMVFGLMPAAGIGMGSVVRAANVEDGGWTVSWSADDEVGSVPDGTSYGNFTAKNHTNKSKITASAKKADGLSFTHRYQFNGTGGKDKVNLNFMAPAGGTLIVYGITGSSSDTTNRKLTLEGPNGYKETSQAFPNDVVKTTFEFTDGGTYYLYSTGGAVNIYYLSYEMALDGTAPVIEEDSVQAVVPDTEAVKDTTISAVTPAAITWSIKTPAQGGANIQIDYKRGNDDWKLAGVVAADVTGFVHNLLEVESGSIQYRVSGLGSTNSPAVLSNTESWIQPRTAWGDVAAPEVAAVQGTGEDAGKIIAQWDMQLGRNGADELEISLYKGTELIDSEKISKADAKGENSGEVSFEAKESGSYSVSAVAYRDTLEKASDTDATVEFTLPLAEPVIQSIRGAGAGKVEVSWETVPEADKYRVFVKPYDAADSLYEQKTETGADALSFLVEGLTDGEKYTFKVEAERTSDSDVTEASMDKYVTGLDERAFQQAPVGSGAKGTAEGDFYGENVAVTIKATGGKIADSEDGFVFYYTELNADENFLMEGTFTVTDTNVGGTMSNQTGFGIIAIDTIAGAGNGNGRYFNSAATATAKYRKLNMETGAASSFDNIAGLRMVSGYTNPGADVGESTRVLDNTDSAFIYPDANSAVHTYEVGETYHFKLRRSNTGYHGMLVKDDGTEIEKLFYYPEGDDYTDPLLVQDPEHIYVGFMASRYIEVEVTDMSLTTIAPEDDEDRIQPPASYTVPSINLYSTTTIGTEEYPFEYRANIAGHLVVKDSKGKVLIDRETAADEYVEETFTLAKGNNVFTCTLTPSTSEKLESYDPIVRTLTVSYRIYGAANETIIAAPNGKATGTGSEAKPLDIYTAFQYAQPGQTILLKNGTYRLTEGIKIDRGHDGTAGANITVVAETPGEVVLDLLESSGGITIRADYWHLYGLDICNAPFGVKVVYIQGNYNTIELCRMYDNGDSGLQISGSSAEPKSKWPCYNLIKNCDAYDNADYKGNDADGFAAKLTSGDGNVFEGCIAHHNIDDGWDLYAKSTTGSIGDVIIRNCVTYSNGFLSENARLKGQLLAEDQGEGNGFKLGGESMPGRHKLINSISFSNGAKGITSNSGPDCIIEDVTSYKNAVFGKAESVSLYTNTAPTTNYEADGVISMAPQSDKADKLAVKGQASLESDTNYFWNGAAAVNMSGEEASERWFESVDVSVLPTRNADGSINMHGLLQLTAQAPSDAGARMEAVVSEYPEIPEAIKDSQQDPDDSDDNDSDDDASDDDSYGDSGSSGGSGSTTTVITTDNQQTTEDLGDTTGEWKKDDKGWWYQKEDASYPAESWLKINGEWYLFGADGYMQSGWQQTGDGKWYFLDQDSGSMKNGWLQTGDGKWYFLDEQNGDMKTGWVETDGKWYFMDPADGSMKTGWVQTADGKWYYLNADGSCAMNTRTPDGHQVNENGEWIR